jgi:tRNA (guanine-N7-)-methyltransferase
MQDQGRREPLTYGRRRGRRLRPGRQALFDALLPRLAIALPAKGTLIDPRSLFPSGTSEIWLEIGFGGGEHLAAQAEAHPAVGLIGAEIFVNGVASLLGHVDRRGLSNVRIFPDDARPLLDALPDASLGRVFLLFPDPWPKRRHSERRFISPANLDRLARVMREGAELRIASDDPGYIAWTLEQMLRRSDFRWLACRAADWRGRPPDWPPTRYERKAINEGHHPVYLRFERVARM